MADTDEGRKTQTEIKNSGTNGVSYIWSIGYIKRKFEERKAKHEKETPADKAIRVTATATAWMAVFTCLLFLVTAGTYIEIKTGGTDTHDLAEAAKKQAAANVQQVGAFAAVAIAAKNQADHTAEFVERMKDQADATKIIASQAAVQANSSKRLAQNAVDTLKHTQESFRSEQRAWVGAQDASGANFSETTVLKATIVFFNSGRTPASEVHKSGMYVTSPTPLSGPSTDQIKQLVFSPVQSIAPQGRYRLIMGASPPAHAVSPAQREGSRTLLSEYTAIKNSDLFLYYFGILRYNDGFGNIRETQFCILLANPATSEVQFCDGFNDMN